jgi:hypothetical protein
VYEWAGDVARMIYLQDRPRRELEGKLKLIIKKYDGLPFTGFMWIKLETSGGLL